MIAQVDKAYIKERPISGLRRIVTRLLFEGRPVTTSYRWTNPLIFAHFALEKNLGCWNSVSQPIFIMGPGRSGTTVLATLLSFHPHVGLLNEPKAMWHSIYDGEDVNGNYTTTLPARYQLFSADVDDKIKQRAHRLFGAFSTLTFSHRIVDKNPEVIFRVAFIQAIFPDAKFIFLIRNGWDTICSIARWSIQNAVQIKGDLHDWWGVNNRKWHVMFNELVVGNGIFADQQEKIRNLERQIDKAAVEWILTVQAGISHYQNQPESIFLLRYEDLVENPQQILNQICDFCKLPDDNKLVQYASKRLKKPKSYEPIVLDSAIADLFQQQTEAIAKLK